MHDFGSDPHAPEDTADVVCPFCGQSVGISLDAGGGSRQDYVEDCEVCCRPWHLIVTYDRSGTACVEISRAD